jgi:uncharacterized membrane protein
MAEQKFIKQEAINFGWDTFKKNWGFFIGVIVIYYGINLVFGLLRNAVQGNTALVVIITIVSALVQMLLSIGLIKISLKFADGQKAQISDLFNGLPNFLNFLLGSILYGLIVLGGTILLIVPGVIWAVKFYYFNYLIIDKGLGPVEAIKKAGEMTNGSKNNLFLFFLLLAGINIVGLICLIVGLFATIPLSIVATAFVYRKLLAAQSAA